MTQAQKDVKRKSARWFIDCGREYKRIKTSRGRGRKRYARTCR